MYGTIGFDESEKLIDHYRKNGFLLEDLGYDKIFVVNIHEISNPEYARQYRMAAYFLIMTMMIMKRKKMNILKN